MRTLEDYTQSIDVSYRSEGFKGFADIVVKYNRHIYKFTSDNLRAYGRLKKKNFVNNKVHLYGYSLKGAYEAYYKEFAKLHKEHSDKLTAIIN